MKNQLLVIFLFFFACLSSFGKEIKSLSINPVSKVSILPGDNFVFYLTITYDDGKQKKVKSSSTKFRNEYLTETEGCSFHSGELVINKLRQQIPNNQATITVISKDDKKLTARRTFEIAYFKKLTVKYERSTLNLGDQLNLLLEATTNTDEIIRLDKNSYTRKWSWFDITTSKGAVFDKGSIVVANDVRQFECDTITFTVFPENADSLKQELHFILNYNKTFTANFDGENGKSGNDGNSSSSSASNGGDGADGENGTDGQHLFVYMTVHPCNKNLLKVEVRDTTNAKTEYFIINKNHGSLKINCNGGQGGNGGDGANGEKGKSAGKRSEPQNGGNGGNGANGGAGGSGGQVMIYSSLKAMPYTGLIIVSNKAGSPGREGKKGKGKDGGKGSMSFPDAQDGSDGVNGDGGVKGKDGGSPTILTQELELTW